MGKTISDEFVYAHEVNSRIVAAIDTEAHSRYRTRRVTDTDTRIRGGINENPRFCPLCTRNARDAMQRTLFSIQFVPEMRTSAFDFTVHFVLVM